MFAKPAVIKVQAKADMTERAKEFLERLFAAMKVETVIKAQMEDEENMSVELSGPDMGILIGKRGQTLEAAISSCFRHRRFL